MLLIDETYNFAHIDIDGKYIILSDSEEDVQKHSSRSYLRNVRYKIKENGTLEISGSENIYQYTSDIKRLDELKSNIHPKYIQVAYSPKSIFKKERLEDYRYVQFEYVVLTDKFITYSLPSNQFIIKKIQTL